MSKKLIASLIFYMKSIRCIIRNSTRNRKFFCLLNKLFIKEVYGWDMRTRKSVTFELGSCDDIMDTGLSLWKKAFS